MATSVIIGGSRALPASAGRVVQRVVSSIARTGAQGFIGCAQGADRAAARAWVAAGAGQRLTMFCAGAPGWASTAPVSRVITWAGGGPAVPVRARLAQRTAAAVRAAAGQPCQHGPGCPCAQQGTRIAVFFLSSTTSKGSMAAAALAARLGFVVFAFGFWQGAGPAWPSGSWQGASVPPAPLAGQAGRWAWAPFAGCRCWRWVPARGLF